MKKLLFYILLLTITSSYAQYTYIPDSSFEHELVIAGYDNAVDGHVLTANIEHITVLYLRGCYISDLTGIQDFTALESLNVNENILTEIDLSQNTNLITFMGDSNYFVHLDFTGNPNIEYISAASQQDVGDFFLETVDVSQCYNLEYLDIGNNRLIETIDVSNSPNLVLFDIGGAPLSEIDVTNCPELEFLDVSRNIATSIDLSQNTQLEFLDIEMSQEIESLDLTHNVNLKTCYCSYVLDVDLSNSISLEFLYVGYDGDPDDTSVGMQELDLTNCISLETLYVVYSNVQEINLNNCPNLKYFYLDQMINLTSFSVRNGHNDDIEDHTHLLDYNWSDDPLFCIEVDDPEAASNMEYPYDIYWGWMANSQYTYAEDCSVSISEEETNNTISVSPNPVTTGFSIENMDVNEIDKITITNQLGQQVKETANSLWVDISDLSKGVYFVKISNKNTQRIIKKIIKD